MRFLPVEKLYSLLRLRRGDTASVQNTAFSRVTHTAVWLLIKLGLYPLIITFSIWTLMASIIAFSNWSSLVERLKAHVKEQTGYVLTLNSNVSLSFYPQFNLTLSDIVVSKPENSVPLVYAPHITLKPDYLAILTGKIRVAAIDVDDAVVTLASHDAATNNWIRADQPLATTLQKAISQDYADLFDGYTLNFRKLDIKFLSGQTQDPVIRMYHAHRLELHADTLQGPYQFEGRLDESNLSLVVKGNLGRILEDTPAPLFASLRLNDGVDMALTGSYDAHNATLDAAVSGQLVDIVKPLQWLLGAHPFTTLLADTFKPVANGVVSGKVSTNNGAIALDNLEIKQQDTVALTASLSLDPGAVSVIRGSVSVPRLDVASLQFEGDGLRRMLLQENGDSIEQWLPYADVQADVTFNIAEVIRGEQKTAMPNVVLSAHQGILKIDGLQFDNLPGQNSLKLGLQFERDNQHNVIWHFSADSDGQDAQQFAALFLDSAKDDSFKQYINGAYKMNVMADVNNAMLSVREFSLHNNGIALLGQAQKSLKQEDADVGRLALRVDNLNMDVFSKTGNAGLVRYLTADYGPLTHNGVLCAVAFYNLTYGGKQIDELTATADLRPGHLDVQQFSLKQKDVTATGALRFSTEGLDSSFEGTINFGAVDIKTVLNALDIRLEDDTTNLAMENRISEEDKIYSFPSLLTYKGVLAVNAQQVLSNNKVLASNLTSSLQFGGGNVSINALKADVFDSNIDITGTIGLERPSLSFVFTLPNSDVRQALKTMLGIDEIYGRASMSGNISMGGVTYTQWKQSMQGAVNFISRGLILQGFDLLNFSRNVAQIDTLRELRRWTNAVLTSGETYVDYTAGAANIVQGELTLKNIQLQHPTFDKASVDLSLNLGSNKLKGDANFVVKLVTANSRQNGNISLHASLEGTATNPTAKWDIKPVEDFWEANFFKRQ